jgi:hypothetical protein
MALCWVVEGDGCAESRYLRCMSGSDQEEILVEK